MHLIHTGAPMRAGYATGVARARCCRGLFDITLRNGMIPLRFRGARVRAERRPWWPRPIEPDPVRAGVGKERDERREKGVVRFRQRTGLVWRVGNPLDIASMALYLASEQAGFLTGENICIDGGMTRLMVYHNDCGRSYHP